MTPPLLRRYNTVVYFYRFCLTPSRILTSLLPNNGKRRLGLRSSTSRFFTAVAAVCVAACATLDSKPAAEVVKERAQARAAAVMAGDTRAIYEYFTPTVRSTLKYEDFAANWKNGFWKSAVVDKVECKAPDVCDTSLSIEYEYRGSRITTPLKQTWIQEGGKWWFATKD